MTETEDLDVYADLEDFDLGTTIKTLETENTKLRKDIEDSNLQINCLKKQVSELSAENGTLKNNISSLMLTAKNEIHRKDNVIAELRREKDQILFRRGKNTASEIKPNNFNNKTIVQLGDADIRCETQEERISVQAISCTQKRKIGFEEYRNAKRSRTDIRPDAKPFIPDPKTSIPDAQPSISDAQPSIPDAQPSIPDAKPFIPDTQTSIPDAKLSIPDLKPSIPDAKPSIPDAQPSNPDAKLSIPDLKPSISDSKPSTLAQVKSNIIINNVNEITIPIKRRKKPIHKLLVHTTSNDTNEQENIKTNDLPNNKILESSNSISKKETEDLDTLKKNNKNICNKETISNSQTHKNSELNTKQEEFSEKNIDDKKYEKDNDLKMMRKSNSRTCEKESDFKLDRRRDESRLKTKDANRFSQKICDTNMARRHNSKNHDNERNSRSDRMRNERRSYENTKHSRPEIMHNDRTRVKDRMERYNGRLRDKNEENRREGFRDRKSVGNRDFKDRAKMDYKSRNDRNDDRRKENSRDRYRRGSNHKGDEYFKEDRRTSGQKRHSRSGSRDRRSHSNLKKRVEDDLIDNIKLRDKLKNQLKNIEDQEKLNLTNRHKPIDKNITDRPNNVKLTTKCVFDSVSTDVDCASEDYESDNLDDSIINMYDDQDEIIPVYKNETNIDIESSEKDNSFKKSQISDGELTSSEDENNSFQKEQKNLNNEDDTHKNAVNSTSMTNNKTEIDYPNYETAFNRYAKNANFDNTRITENRKTQINKTNADRQTPTVETINTNNLSKEETERLQVKISTGDTKLRTIPESESISKSNVVSTNGDEEIKEDLKVNRSRNNQAIVKTSKDICNPKLTKDIKDLFGEIPVKSIGDTNKIRKICEENVTNRDTEIVNSYIENINDDFEENFDRKRSDDSLILEMAVASITGDSESESISKSNVVSTNGDEEIKEDLKVNRSRNNQAIVKTSKDICNPKLTKDIKDLFGESLVKSIGDTNKIRKICEENVTNRDTEIVNSYIENINDDFEENFDRKRSDDSLILEMAVASITGDSESESISKSNVVSTNGDEEIKEDLKVNRSRNNQAIVKTSKDICNPKLTKDIKDLFGESPVKSIGDTNKIRKICEENVTNRDTEIVNSYIENINDDFEENFDRKRSDDSLILEMAVASITGDSESESISKSNVVSTNGDEEIKEDLKVNRSRNNQAIVKTSKDICNPKLTKDIKDLFGESPVKSIGDTNKIRKICEENVTNRDTEIVNSYIENINDDFEENFDRKRSDDSLILEMAVASITGDSYDNNIHNTENIKQKELVFRNIREISPLEQEMACNNVVEITNMEQELIYNVPEITITGNQETASESMNEKTIIDQEIADNNNVLETPTSKQGNISNDVGERTTPNSLSKLNSLISTKKSTYSRTVVDKNETTFSITRKSKKRKKP